MRRQSNLFRYHAIRCPMGPHLGTRSVTPRPTPPPSLPIQLGPPRSTPLLPLPVPTLDHPLGATTRDHTEPQIVPQIPHLPPVGHQPPRVPPSVASWGSLIDPQSPPAPPWGLPFGHYFGPALGASHPQNHPGPHCGTPFPGPPKIEIGTHAGPAGPSRHPLLPTWGVCGALSAERSAHLGCVRGFAC